MDPAIVYPAEFYQKHVPLRGDYEAIADWIHERWHAESVLDCGCGNAFILSRLKQLNPQLTGLGLDAAPAALAAVDPEIRPFVKCGDLRQRIKFDRKWDLVICLEVAEHLEAQYADVLVNTLTSAAGSVILFSAAPPGSPGLWHVNCQGKKYWIDKFWHQFWADDPAATSAFRFALADKIEQCRWFLENTMIFVPIGQRA